MVNAKRVPFTISARLLEVTVLGFSDFENVSTTVLLGAIELAPSFGVTIVTVGWVVSLPAPVTKLLEKEVVVRVPDKSATPLLGTCTSMLAFAGIGERGANVKTSPLESSE
jgi:hypothetical protein